MATDSSDISAARVQRFFEALLTRDGAGGSWLSSLLAVAPRGRERLGELVVAPGWLEAPLAVRTETGRRGAFEYPAAPTRQLLGWYLDHPEALSWPARDDASVETTRLRRALLADEPPGARPRAQDRAHDLLRRSSPLGHAWWRFEEVHTPDCVLRTDRLVVVIQGRCGGETPPPATPWFPQRSALVRDLEAARRLAGDARAWGVLVLSDQAGPDDGPPALAAAVAAGAPHLDATEQADLGDAYLGSLTWAQAGAAAGLDDPAAVVGVAG